MKVRIHLTSLVFATRCCFNYQRGGTQNRPRLLEDSLHRDAAAAAKEAILGATLHFNAGGVDFLFMLKSEEAEGMYSGSGTRTTYYLSYTHYVYTTGS